MDLGFSYVCADCLDSLGAMAFLLLCAVAVIVLQARR
jgi:hypothetical protein